MNIFLKFKHKISSQIPLEQRTKIHNIGHTILSPYLSKKYILITGCQRSGTTLTFLMLNAHPLIYGLDEGDTGFNYPTPLNLLSHSLKGDYTCSKLPTRVSDVNKIKKFFPEAKILFTIRHPYSVISSMKNLWPERNWINRCAKEELGNLSSLFPEINNLKVDCLPEIYLASYIWKYKNLALSIYEQKKLNLLSLRYEDLLDNPQFLMEKILNFLDLPWSENVLNHHQFADHKKVNYIGNTRSDKPIDQARKNPKLTLAKSDLEIINDICGELMANFNYDYKS